MYIVGTSGHIDHGKTSIIKLLSGIDCDRLPEEKEREMTIDLGFASIEYPRFGTVSIIDVPGHERFIRNMVAGAWGIDLALLIIAVDDGWMPQTEDHFRVLELLGLERMIIVLNKMDLADAEMVAFVEEEVNEKLEETRYRGSDMVKVSAKTGTRIEELKEAIVVNLRRLSRSANTKKPYLFLDRVFQAKGHGTVVTGTLKNGIFHENETVTILPGTRGARIKRIESHFSQQSESVPSQRTALNLTGISSSELKRGDIVCSDNFFSESAEILAGIRKTGKKDIKNNSGIELLIGTANLTGKIIYIKGEDSSSESLICRIKLSEQWYFYPDQPFVLTSPGGYRILGGGRVLLPRYNARSMKKSVKENLPRIKTLSLKEIVSFIIAVHRWLPTENLFSLFPYNEKKLKKVTDELFEEEGFLLRNEKIIEKAFFKDAAEKISACIEEHIGLNLKEIADSTGVPAEISAICVNDILQAAGAVEKEGRYFSGSAITEDTLTKEKKELLDEIYCTEGSGVELSKSNDPRWKKNMGDLIRLGFLISLDGNIIYHRDVYNGMREKIMELFNERDKISVPEAKEAVSLSRKYTIPLLNRIERDGLIKRIGDFRIKA